MELKNKRIVFLGDSITEGYGTSSEEKTFHQLLKEKYQLSLASNCGVGGTRIARQINPSYANPRHDLYFRLRATVMPKDADIVIVFGGTNDSGHGDAPFGDIDSTNDYTFNGALNNLIKQLKQDYPNSKIIFLTPIHRLWENECMNNSGYILKDYVNAIITATKRHNVGLIDLFNELELDPHDETLVPDGLHPNDSGHKILADFIGKKLIMM